MRELILYVADSSVDDPGFGSTKLNKILAFSDFQAFAVLGQPITGMAYQKLEHGPALRRMLPLQREMIADGEAQLAPHMRGPYKQQRLIALRAPDLDVFKAAEIAIVDSVIEQFRHLSAVEVSDRSHDWAGWQAAEIGEDIPYATAFWIRHALSSDDIAQAQEFAAADR